MIDRDRLVQTFCEMVRIDSPSGYEDEMAEDMTRRLEALGFDVFADSYGNLIASEDGGTPIMLSGHLDTVEPGRGIEPTVQGDRITSDGTTILGGDNKSGLAIILETLQHMKEDGTSRIPVEVVVTREEEPGLIGAHNLDFSHIASKEAIVLDREGPVSRISSSSPTYVAFDISVTGRAAHAGVDPEMGIAAVRVAAEIVTRLPQGRLDEVSTFNVGIMEGGSTRNTVPESAVVRGEFRTTSIETLDGLKMELRDVVEAVRRLFPKATIKDETTTKFETFSLSDDDACLRRVITALRSLGLEPDLRYSGGGSDANVFRQHGISAVVVGLADSNMHTVREYVTIPDMLDGVRFLEAVLAA